MTRHDGHSRTTTKRHNSDSFDSSDVWDLHTMEIIPLITCNECNEYINLDVDGITQTSIDNKIKWYHSECYALRDKENKT